MRFYRGFNGLYKTLSFVILSVFFTACAEVGRKDTLSFDTRLVDSMVFQFENNTHFMDISLPVEGISKQVSINLQEWGYIFKPEENTHDLKISIGEVSRSSTPFGLSFNAGNSNPRSLDFQKSSTFPLTCSLMPKGQEHRAELVMDVMAESYTTVFNKSKQTDKIVEQLTDDISTVCYNLLSGLNIKTKELASAERKLEPTWIPEVRIEVENEIEIENKQVKVIKEAVNSQNNKQTSKPSVKKEACKRIIIHNKGTPIIFKFGTDRK